VMLIMCLLISKTSYFITCRGFGGSARIQYRLCHDDSTLGNITAQRKNGHLSEILVQALFQNNTGGHIGDVLQYTAGKTVIVVAFKL